MDVDREKEKADGGTGPSDADVVRRILDGDRGDFKVLIRRYQGRFHRFALGIVGDPDAATDLVQDSFVKAYADLESCRDPTKFEAWAYQILRNRCRDFLKNVRRDHETLDDHPQLVSRIAGPGEELERSELRRTLWDALATLPGAHREAFLLKHLDGHSYQEISEMLGASLSAVKMRVHRSREMLRSHLANRAGPGGDVTFSGPESSFEIEAPESDHHSTGEER